MNKLLDFLAFLFVSFCIIGGIVFFLNNKELQQMCGIGVLFILSEKEAFSLKHLAINGDDLKSIGFREGKELGDMLKSLLDMVINDPELNNRELLLDMARK